MPPVRAPVVKEEREKPYTKKIVKVSGKDIERVGVEAFIFISLHGFNNTPCTNNATRDKLFRKVLGNIWKSLTIGDRQITEITTCMALPANSLAAGEKWKPPVDIVFESTQAVHTGGNADFNAWRSTSIPVNRPIVFIGVTDHPQSWEGIRKEVGHCNVVAYHRLDYTHSTSPGIVKLIYGREPEGTIETKEQVEVLTPADQDT